MRKTTNRKRDAEKSKPLPTINGKKRKQTGEQQEHGDKEQEQEQKEEHKGKTGRKFFACYLLTSLCPRSKRRTYIGFTVNPRRRIRQHNGEITSGAFRTKKGRPWEMVLCIYGFPTNVSALQFEWAWQHPTESLAVRAAAATFKSFTGVANKIKLAHTMLNLSNWQSFNITVNYFSTKYAKHSAVCPSLPKHMKVQVFPMDELPCYTGASESSSDCEGAGDAFDDDEEHEKDSSESETVKENAVELQAWSMDEFPCCHGRDESFFDSEGKESEEEYRKASDTSRKVNQTHANVTGQGSADTDSIDKTASYEQYGRFKEYGMREMTDPLSPVTHNPVDVRRSFQQLESFEVDHVQPSDLFSLPARTALHVSTGFSTRETQDEDLLARTNDDVSELGWMRGKEINNKVVADRGQESGQGPTVRQEVEIIDLLSPSPIRRIGASSKNGRASPDSPLIIDSTSPICRVESSSKNRRASPVSPLIIDLTK